MTSMDMLPDSLIELEIKALQERRTYDPTVHGLEYVINDLDARAQRMERALRALAEEPGTPFAAAEKALKILDGEESSEWTVEDGGYPKAGERGDVLS